MKLKLTAAQRNCLALIGASGGHSHVHFDVYWPLYEAGLFVTRDFERDRGPGLYRLSTAGVEAALNCPLGQACSHLVGQGFEQRGVAKPGHVRFVHADGRRAMAFRSGRIVVDGEEDRP
jgi:hypothetical protein